MKKVLLVATVQSHICQFHKPLVEILHERGIEVHVAARNNLAEKNGLQLDFVDKVFDVPFQRSPISFRNIKAYKMLKRIINEGEYDVIHCNTPVGGILTRMAAKKARKRGAKVFYTAHGFHFYKGAPLKNWLLWYPIEKHFAKRCDKLLTINEEDCNLAKKKFKAEVVHMHGVGVDIKRFYPIADTENIKLREAEGLSQSDFVILCVGELNANKNQKMLISAAALLKDKIADLKVLFAGNGDKERELKAQTESCGLNGVVKFLGYRKDLENIIPFIDLGVSCSKREGLGLNLIEIMLCKKPVIATKNRGHNELIEDGVNGYLVDSDNVSDMADKIKEIYENNGLRSEMAENGYEVALRYSKETVKKELVNIYGF
ncbi:MAG: glycosyltransferase family 4 protein [Clostridia bacterium]|nr:glycosyltransferase family 4 protein [Clostridia bacterium]